MYIPKYNACASEQEAIRFMQRYSFATLISSTSSTPIASHLPVSTYRLSETGPVRISGHFAKANSHWRQLNGTTLVIFKEPHAYISTKHYETKQSVPTWNYLAVHASGTAKTLNTSEAKQAVLTRMITELEPEYLAQWNQLSPQYKEGMLGGVVAFEIEVEELQFKKKLSQNKSKSERETIIKRLSQSDEPNDTAIATIMAENES